MTAPQCPHFTDIIGVTGKQLRCGTKLVWACVNHTEVILCEEHIGTIATRRATEQEKRIATNSIRVDYHVDNATTKD
jgi:hypothetical protein